MTVLLIKGTFHIRGYQPDGDSIRFRADNPALWEWFGRRPVVLNAQQHAQLRIEGIDTLEIHYQNQHQPLTFARKAVRLLQAALGIRAVSYTKSGLKVRSAQDATRGYILTHKADGTGRPVAFVFAGDCPDPDGTELDLDPARVERSVNFRLARAGLAYPTFYSGLAAGLRAKLTEAVVAARQAGAGFWPRDKTTSGANASKLWWLTHREVILPKLFRRLVTHLQAGGTVASFKAYLAANPDPVKDLTTGKWTRLDRLVEVQGARVRLTVQPEHLVFREKA